MTQIATATDRGPTSARASARSSTFQLLTRDRVALEATRFHPTTDARAVLVIAPAIAVAQRFYRHVAHVAQSEGFDTITLDYRHIGRNAPPSLRHVRGDLLAWGEQDLAAAVEFAANTADTRGLPTFLLAHSFGGQALGMLPNHDRLRACFTFGTGPGWTGWMPSLEAWRVRFLWHVLGPALTAKRGYLAWNALGMGEDLPLEVYRQWKSWCRHPHYCFDDPQLGAILRRRFAQVRIPIAAACSTDDRWSPPRSRDAFMHAYSGTSVERIDIDPASTVGGIGHMGYFRPNAVLLWRRAFEWFSATSPRRSPRA